MRRALFLFFLLLASPALGAIAYDNATSGAYDDTGSQTIAHTTSGSDRYLLACGIIRDTSDEAYTIDAGFPKYNNVSMSLIDSQVLNATAAKIFLYGLINPTTGANNFTIQNTANDDQQWNLVSYTGVHQTVATGTAAKATATDTGPATVAVTSAAGELVVDCMGMREDVTETPAAGGGQTQRATHNTAALWWTKMSEEAGAASVTMSWTFAGGAEHWAIIGAPLKPVAGSGTRRPIVVLVP